MLNSLSLYIQSNSYALYNLSYFVLVLPVVIISMIVSGRVNSTFNKYDRQLSSRRITGAQAAQNVLKSYGITNVAINQIQGKLSDHYDPTTNTINLSAEVFNSTSVAAIGVACHEAGHAAQHAQGYKPIKVRNALLMPARIGSNAAIPLALLGLFLGMELLVEIGIFLYVFIMLFQLVTLPVEFNASNRALEVIERTGMLSDDEIKGSKKVLKAAAMTYVASFAVSAVNLLRLLLISRNNRR